MQNMKNGFLRKRKLFEATLILFLIASLIICIACKMSDSNRFYFATTENNEMSLEAQYLNSSSAFHFDFAREESLRSATQSYSNMNYSTPRNSRSGYQAHLMFLVFLLVSTFVILNHLRSYGYFILQKENFSSICITKFIEQSDGKK